MQEITNKKIWERFLEKDYKGFYPFFQTWEWGEVQKKLNHPIKRIGLYNKDKVVGIVLLVYIQAKRGNYYHLRHGPLFCEYKLSYLKFLVKHLMHEAKNDNVDFIRVSPLISVDNQGFFEKIGFRNSPVHNMDAEVCWVLDITKPQGKLLTQMRKSHRYLIKKALSGAVKIRKSNTFSKKDEVFLDLYKQLATKKGFVAHKGIVEEMDVLGKNNKAMLFTAYYQGKLVGGAIIVFSGPMAIYHHSAMDEAYRNIPISYLIQWEAILEAKKRGKKLYNFWGIAPDNKKNHPWKGLTLFKTGFGGEKKEFMHAKDLPLRIWYFKTYLIETINRIRRGY